MKRRNIMLALNEKLNEKFEGFFNEVIEGSSD